MRIAVGVLITIFVAGYHGQIKYPQRKNVERAGEQSPPKTVTTVGDTTPTEQEKPACQKSHNYLIRAFGPEYLASWVLVFAAGFGIYFTYRTLRAIQRQTNAMVNSERAWVIAELIPKRFENMDEDLTYHLRVTNMGRTPAFVTKYTISSSRSDKRGIVRQGLLASDSPNRSLEAGRHLTFDDRPINLSAHIEEGNIALVFLGSVTYQHVFDRTKFVEEPFCYVLDTETTTLKRMPTPNPNEQKEKAN